MTVSGKDHSKSNTDKIILEELTVKQTTPTNVTAAFELLLEEIENEIELINQAGAKSFSEGQYERVDAARQHALRLTEYRSKLASLRHDWKVLAAAFNPTTGEEEVDRAPRRDFGRLQRGVRASEEVFRVPILEVLVSMGDSGKVRDVLAQVEKMVHDQLSEADYEHLPSTPNSTRWYNTAQWARNSLLQEGLLRDDSPRGVWEISQAGKDYLAT